MPFPLSQMPPIDRDKTVAQAVARIVEALGMISDGGIIEMTCLMKGHDARVPHDLNRREIGAAVWPFPPDQPTLEALIAIGYTPIPCDATGESKRFVHCTQPFALRLMEAGSPEWTDYIVLSAYLNLSPNELSASYDHKRPLLGIMGTEPAADLVQTARNWWIESQGFGPLHRTLRELIDFDRPWWVGGGWAIDLFLGRVTRLHCDVDISIARSDQLTLQAHLSERNWKLMAPDDGRLEPWPPSVFLELPRHQAHAHRDGEFLDVLFGEVSDGVWRFRRKQEIVRTMDRVVMRNADGVPFIAPEIALLFKSRSVDDDRRQKDRDDFELASPRLEPERRAWLRWALTVWDPAHPWIARLDAI